MPKGKKQEVKAARKLYKVALHPSQMVFDDSFPIIPGGVCSGLCLNRMAGITAIEVPTNVNDTTIQRGIKRGFLVEVKRTNSALPDNLPPTDDNVTSNKKFARQSALPRYDVDTPEKEEAREKAIKRGDTPVARKMGYDTSTSMRKLLATNESDKLITQLIAANYSLAKLSYMLQLERSGATPSGHSRPEVIEAILKLAKEGEVVEGSAKHAGQIVMSVEELTEEELADAP